MRFRFVHSDRNIWFALALTTAIFTGCPLATAQNPVLRRAQKQQQEMQRRMQEQMKRAAENQPELPADPQLLSLHKEFITKAEKLASEYERKKQYDRARETFEAMARLVPNYAPAETGLARVLRQQSLKDRELMEVRANLDWQDSGVVLQKDMPVHLEVKGSWKVVLETGAQGVEIPPEKRPRDSKIQLGTLIGVIANSPSEIEKAKPMAIRSSMDFKASQTGRFYMKMFDLEPSDNEGKIFVLIQSSFAK